MNIPKFLNKLKKMAQWSGEQLENIKAVQMMQPTLINSFQVNDLQSHLRFDGFKEHLL